MSATQAVHAAQVVVLLTKFSEVSNQVRHHRMDTGADIVSATLCTNPRVRLIAIVSGGEIGVALRINGATRAAYKTKDTPTGLNDVKAAVGQMIGAWLLHRALNG